MLSLSKSQTEVDFLVAGVETDVRSDGRARVDYRDIGVEVDVHSGANGSSRVTLGQGATEVLAVVKVELSQPSHDEPRKGRLEVNVEVSPMALLGKVLSGDTDTDELNAELTQTFASFLRKCEALDMASLCVTPGRFCWTVFLDVLVMKGQGNMLDAVSFAAYAALRTARIPKIDAISGGLDAGNNPIEEFELCSDVTEATPLPVKNLPICITLNRIGNYLVLDTSEEEEQCVQGRISVAVDEGGRLCGVQKGAGGGFPARELQGMAQHLVQAASTVLAGLRRAIGLPPAQPATTTKAN